MNKVSLDVVFDDDCQLDAVDTMMLVPFLSVMEVGSLMPSQLPPPLPPLPASVIRSCCTFG